MSNEDDPKLERVPMGGFFMLPIGAIGQGSLNGTHFLRHQTTQMDGKFEGFPLYFLGC